MASASPSPVTSVAAAPSPKIVRTDLSAGLMNFE
jgi:hypothetical protein